MTVRVARIRESFASGPVTALSAALGTQAAISYSNTGHIADNVFWDVKANTVGVFTGTPVPATNGLTPAQMRTASSFGPTWDFSKNSVWVIPPGGTDPILRWQTASQ